MLFQAPNDPNLLWESNTMMKVQLVPFFFCSHESSISHRWTVAGLFRECPKSFETVQWYVATCVTRSSILIWNDWLVICRPLFYIYTSPPVSSQQPPCFIQISIIGKTQTNPKHPAKAINIPSFSALAVGEIE